MTSYSSSTVTMSFSSIISELQQLTDKKFAFFAIFSHSSLIWKDECSPVTKHTKFGLQKV